MSKSPLTPSDLLSPNRLSGYRYVGYWRLRQPPRTPYFGQVQKKRDDGRPGSMTVWRGPERDTALEAAQDVCDYFNGDSTSSPATLKTAGHEYVVDERDADPEYQAALGTIRDRTAQRRARQGYVYLITDGEYLKIGYSVNPKKRAAELQTGNARKLTLLGFFPGTEADERKLHRKYIKDNELQEWFRISDALLSEFV